MRFTHLIELATHSIWIMCCVRCRQLESREGRDSSASTGDVNPNVAKTDDAGEAVDAPRLSILAMKMPWFAMLQGE